MGYRFFDVVVLFEGFCDFSLTACAWADDDDHGHIINHFLFRGDGN